MIKKILKSYVSPIVNFQDDEEAIKEYELEEKRIINELSSILITHNCIKFSFDGIVKVLSKNIRNNGYQLSSFTLEKGVLKANYHEEYLTIESVLDELVNFNINNDLTVEF